MGTSSDQFRLRAQHATGDTDLTDPSWEVIAHDGTVIASGLAPVNDLYKDHETTGEYTIFQSSNCHNVIVGADEFPTIATTRTYSLYDGAAQLADSTVKGTCDFAEVACLSEGSLIATPAGERPVETLEVGDLVRTLDAADQRIIWKSQSHIKFGPDSKHLAPIHISKGALGFGYPHDDLLVSPDHLILVTGWKIELHFGADEAFVPAKYLVNGTTIKQRHELTSVTYHHILLENHEVMFANGLECESLFPDTQTLSALPSKAKLNLLKLGYISGSSQKAYPEIPEYVAQACFGTQHGTADQNKSAKRLAA
ncbi:hypothetical protein GV827_15545 [Sulfitobacter sp. JBTF-M27]|uniref:Hedgehog/Intein (Hint) domain-containing protein n=1 Tax=Sulfitobacter sediminilitoris TaxID=2698830 RepID=A0A6P0CC58_9RHOB|nr:Hint domain-containing protein [Sulfitobacter sediminilitoris]NEK23811.1 hypothetical protein [Sulfitobacter sediminilitoris]